MPTNTKESGLEALIVNCLVEQNGYEQGTNDDYDRAYALDTVRLFRFLNETQPEQMAKLDLSGSELKRAQFLDRVQGEITRRGVVDVLRRGIRHGPADLTLFYVTPSEHNEAAKKHFAQNVFSVTRQLMYAGSVTPKLSFAIGGYTSFLDYGGRQMRDAGLSALLAYQIDEHWEASAFIKKSFAQPRLSPQLYWLSDVGDKIGASVQYHFNPSFSIGVSVWSQSEPRPIYHY